MNSQELRQIIIDKKIREKSDSQKIAHGLANYIAPMLSFLNAGTIGLYGDALGCNDLEVLQAAANNLKEELRTQLDQKDWDTFFKPEPGSVSSDK